MRFFIIFALTIFVDQLTKYLIYINLSPYISIPIAKDILHITYVRNSGMAFGMFINQTIFFIIVSIIAILLILLYLRRSRSFIQRLSLTLILSGAIGNLIDRLRFGCVIDFIDIRIWPVFNIADSSITIGAVLLGWSMLIKKKSVTSDQ